MNQHTSPGLSCLAASPRQLTANRRLSRRTLVSSMIGLQGLPRSVVMRGPHGVFFTLVQANCLHVKGGCLSIATQGSYWFSSPHPLALSMASPPGIPATAETRSRAGTRGRRAERGAKARGERHTRTSPSNLAPADARTRRHTRERPLILEISHHPEAPATVAPSPHLMQSRVSDAALLSHRTTAA